MFSRGLDGEVIGFSFDGLGLGMDGSLLGAEAMIAGYHDFHRLYHFEFIPLPGGDKANQEPWRMAVSYLYHCFGSGFRELPLPLHQDFEGRDIEMIKNLIDKSVNTPLISSAGRLFDAVAAILGINYRATYQAEAPMKLESIADVSERNAYPVEINGDQVQFQTMIRCIAKDKSAGISNAKISGKFHNTIARLVLDLAIKIRMESGLKRVVLSGGSFQNRILTGKLIKLLSAEGFEIFLPDKVPVNDQGIALGQIAVGAATKRTL
jgi:hydrogenase maturation protein HypF